MILNSRSKKQTDFYLNSEAENKGKLWMDFYKKLERGGLN